MSREKKCKKKKKIIMEIAKHKGKRENRLRAGQDTCSLCRIEAERRARYALYAMELVQFHGRYASAYYSRSSLEASTLYRCIYIYISVCVCIYIVYTCVFRVLRCVRVHLSGRDAETMKNARRPWFPSETEIGVMNDHELS